MIGIETLNDYWTKRLRVKGVAILSVREGLPADQAGMIGVREDLRGKIHLGDVIIAINGTNVVDEDSLLSQLEKQEPGNIITITTLRDDKIHNYQVTLMAPDG